MKTKIAFLAFFLIFTFVRVSGQSVAAEAMDNINITSAGPPTFETTTSGLEISVWVMTQEEHRKMMEGMNDQMKTNKDNEGTMDKTGKKATMTGMYHIRVVMKDAATWEIRNDVSTKVEVNSPSNKISWVSLKNMSNHYGSDLTFKEKGPYMLTIRIDDKGVPKTTQFKYTVQ